MIQDDKNSTARERKIIVNERVLSVVDTIVKTGLAKSAAQLAEKTGYDSSNASRYKKGQGFIGTDEIYGLVNEYDVNPNFIFKHDGPNTESMILERSIHIAGNVGNNNTITNEHNSNKPTINVSGTVGNLNVVHTLEKLISDMPPDMQEKLLTHFNYMNREMESLKKTADRYEKQLVDKNEQLDEKKRELVETKNLLKKKDAQLTQKDVELHQTKDELIKVQKNVNDLQSMYVETVKKTEEIILSQTGKKPGN